MYDKHTGHAEGCPAPHGGPCGCDYLDAYRRANAQPWFTNATERPPEYDAICDALVAAGLCTWDGSRHPQSFALVALWAIKEHTHA